MPSKTASGLPYPLPSEPVRDGAVSIQNLASAVDVRIQAGSAIIVTTAGSGDGYIPFPVAFKSGTKPVVIVQFSDPSTSFGGVLAWSFFQYTDATKIAVRVTNMTGGLPPAGNYRMEWHAIGVVT